MNKEFFISKTVLVMGLGRFGGGVDATKFAASAGAKVIVTDLAPAEKLQCSINQLKEFPDIKYHLGSHNIDDFEKADIVIANPAVPGDNKFLEIARRHNKLITSQINIFFELCPATIIGITGANGKSTTTALTTHLLRGTRDDRRRTADDPGFAFGYAEAGGRQMTDNRQRMMDEGRPGLRLRLRRGRQTRDEKVWLSGNIGNEPLLTILDQINPNDLVVLELSSFQLEQLAQIQKAPQIALLTNLTPNHLDRYGTFAKYCAAKENIFKFQKMYRNCPAVSIFNGEDKIAAEWFEKYKIDAERTCIKFSADDVSEEIRESFPLPGRANLSNLAAAVTIARHLGINDGQIKNTLPEFKALPHRLELVAQVNGVRWYNDSKSTTPQSAITALEAFDQPIIIIAGGYDKNIPFDELGQRIAEKAKAAILLGQTAPKIAEAIKMSLRGVSQGGRRSNLNKRGTSVEIVSSLAEAVNLARQLAENGDVVLLSPACASYDMFDNFEQRGREFARLVQEIATKTPRHKEV
jgi:UDP-N-acetylmuramoylalanine--D-glutamate ligase